LNWFFFFKSKDPRLAHTKWQLQIRRNTSLTNAQSQPFPLYDVTNLNKKIIINIKFCGCFFLTFIIHWLRW
jgi:hypothetical protein